MIHLAIIDGSRIFADALAARLGAEPDIRVLRCATGAAAFRQAINQSSVDVVVGDAALFEPHGGPGAAGPHRSQPGTDAGCTEGGARRPGCPALILLADHADRGRLVTAVQSGVRGWVPRDATVGELILASREAADGGTWIPPKVLTVILEELTWTPSADDPVQMLLASLTPRERDVLSCLADGLGRVEVAARLQVSTNTVRTHVQSILAKLGVNSSVAAVALMRKAGERSAVQRLQT